MSWNFKMLTSQRHDLCPINVACVSPLSHCAAELTTELGSFLIVFTEWNSDTVERKIFVYERDEVSWKDFCDLLKSPYTDSSVV
jgi:hypothetical protein